MTDAEIATIREAVNRPDECLNYGSRQEMLEEFTPALLAHIDVLAAEITDREGKYVDLLRTKHALAAEVERLKGENHLRCNIINRFPFCPDHRDKVHDDRCLKCESDSLRDLVREAEKQVRICESLHGRSIDGQEFLAKAAKV